MTTASHSIDALIQRIRTQAAWEEPLPQNDAASFMGAGASLQLSPIEALEIEILRRGEVLDARDFFGMDDDKFIRLAYRYILLRSADEEGYRNCTQLLAAGGSRLVILRNLLRSEEAQSNASKMRGLTLAPVLVVIDWLARKYPQLTFARNLIRFIETRYTISSDKSLAEKKRGIQAHAAILRFLDSWRVPLEINGGRIVVLERELALLRQQNKSMQQDLMLMREDSLYARRAALSIAPSASSDESATSATSTISATTSAPSAPSASSADLDAYYVAFEDANRGSKEEFIAKLGVYTSLFDTLKQKSAALLDIGCGRGELLSHLREQGIGARGIDLNRVMVQTCREAGLDVHLGDVLAYLRSLPDQSLSAVTGFHIIEHLPFDVLYQIFSESYRVLQQGCFILFETPNPENLLVGSHTFYHDFTHRNPVTPSAIQFLARYHNFCELQIIRSNPYPKAAQVPGGDPLTERVNGHLCGPQDYALLAYRPKLSPAL